MMCCVVSQHIRYKQSAVEGRNKELSLYRLGLHLGVNDAGSIVQYTRFHQRSKRQRDATSHRLIQGHHLITLSTLADQYIFITEAEREKNCPIKSVQVYGISAKSNSYHYTLASC